MSTKTQEALRTERALKLALEALEDYVEEYGPHEKDSGAAYAITTIREALTEQPAQRKPLTDEQINLFINGRGEEGDDDYVEPTGDGFGLTDADLVQLVRRVEAAHGIYAPSELKENE